MSERCLPALALDGQAHVPGELHRNGKSHRCTSSVSAVQIHECRVVGFLQPWSSSYSSPRLMDKLMCLVNYTEVARVTGGPSIIYITEDAFLTQPPSGPQAHIELESLLAKTTAA